VPNALKLKPTTWKRTSRPSAATRQARAFLAVQDGCNHDCTFCITRIARGPARSLPMSDVVAAARTLINGGAAELVLTGIDLTDWGRDLDGQPRLGQLVEALLSGLPGLRRLRLSSIDGAEADDALIEAFGDPRIMPQAHLSLQSGDDLVLARMKRRHRRADAIRLVERLKRARPDIAIGADFIAGFPTEAAEAHARSLSLLDEADIVQVHVFPFSPRPGTAAARMPQLPVGTVRARAAELRAAATERRQRFMEGLVGQIVETVSEGDHGLTPQGVRLRYARPREHGNCVVARAAGAENGMLFE
jgi:threonylcarbamoyladenosine tRNA methylthiotransferase MtaB